MSNWTIQDFNEGKCDVADVGLPKARENAAQPSKVTYESTKDAIDQVFRMLDGVEGLHEFAKDNKRFFYQALLAKTIPMEQHHDVRLHLVHSLPPPRYTPNGAQLAEREGVTIEQRQPSEADALVATLAALPPSTFQELMAEVQRLRAPLALDYAEPSPS